jgi:hypothetical protein
MHSARFMGDVTVEKQEYDDMVYVCGILQHRYEFELIDLEPD